MIPFAKFLKLNCLCFSLPISHILASNSITKTIQGKLQLPEALKRLDPLNSTLVSLNNGEYTTYTTSTNDFTFYNVPPGVHLLNVHCHKYHFSQIKIQLIAPERTTIDDNGGEEEEDPPIIPKCIEYIYPGASKKTIKYPLTLTAHAEYDYFERRRSFSSFNIFKNPMILMALFSVVLMFVMPSMMQNLDPEQKEQMKKQMEMQSDPQKMLSNIWGDISGKKEVTEKKVVKRDGKTRMKRE